MQNEVFLNIKGHLSQRNTPPFTTQKAAFRMIKRRLLHAKSMPDNRIKSSQKLHKHYNPLNIRHLQTAHKNHSIISPKHTPPRATAFTKRQTYKLRPAGMNRNAYLCKIKNLSACQPTALGRQAGRPTPCARHGIKGLCPTWRKVRCNCLFQPTAN